VDSVYLGGSGTVDVVALAGNLLCPHSWFSGSKRKSSRNYRAECGIRPSRKILPNTASALFAIFIREFSTAIGNITSIPCV